MAIIISYPISASRIIVKYYVHMGGGAGRTLKQVAHACNTRQSVSYHIRSWEEKSRILPDFICNKNALSSVESGLLGNEF